MQEGVLVIDNQKRIVDANRRMKAILSGFGSRLIGTNISAIGMEHKELVNALSGNTDNKIEIKMPVDGVDKYFAVTITSLQEKTSVYGGQFLLFRDVTERHQTEQRLQDLNQLKDRLFSVISHDLRSPLNTLLGILTMVNEGHISEEELKQILPEISKNLSYTTGLVNNLLQWTKSQLQGEVVKPLQFDIHKTVNDAVNLSNQTASEKNIRIINAIPENTAVFADEDMIQAVLRNLVSNAVKFSRALSQIDISISNENNFATICVKDEGIGMNEEDLAKLFGVETFTTRGTIDEKGTGLGLLLCKEFVEKNGGKIWATSKYGEGSSFCFTIPC